MFLPDPSPPHAPASTGFPVAILGAGVTGLAAAYRLTQAGQAVRLFDVADRTGGVVRSESENGWLWESGPNSFLENSKEVVTLLEQLGLDSARTVASPAAKKRFIVHRGRPEPVPSSPASLLSTPLFSWRTKFRLLREPLYGRRERPADVSLADLVRDHFGPEIVERALNPFVSGVYAGDPEKLSARHAFPSVWASERSHGSLLRGLIAQAKARKARGEPKSRVISFSGGLQMLPDALTRALPPGSLCLNTRVERLIPGKHGAPWLLKWTDQGVAHTEAFSAVILALPARALAQLDFGHQVTRPLASLHQVAYPPVTSLFLGFPRAKVQHPLDGFGALVPAREKLPFLGVLFSSTLFPHRAPEGHVALTVMAGGSLRPDLTSLPTDALLAEILPSLRSLLGLSGEPVFIRRNTWTHAIPQYNLGYENVLETLEVCEHAHEGLYIGGQLRDGIALPACLQAGLKLAHRVLKL